MKKRLTDNAYSNWPIVSVAGKSLRDGDVIASLYTWYRYARIFGITKPSAKKEKKRVGLIASYPNEYLHVDTTYYQINDDQRACIAFVIDSFSKIILGFAVGTRISFEVVKEALGEAVISIQAHPNYSSPILVADGGKENHNIQIDDFIATLIYPKLHKITALKDIRFSNSPVEAIHKIIKGQYLRNRKFQDLNSLRNFIEEAVFDYNCIRPHYKFYPKTPKEVYLNMPLPFDVDKRKAQAIKKRRKLNKKLTCNSCIAQRSLNNMTSSSISASGSQNG